VTLRSGDDFLLNLLEERKGNKALKKGSKKCVRKGSGGRIEEVYKLNLS